MSKTPLIVGSIFFTVSFLLSFVLLQESAAERLLAEDMARESREPGSFNQHLISIAEAKAGKAERQETAAGRAWPDHAAAPRTINPQQKRILQL